MSTPTYDELVLELDFDPELPAPDVSYAKMLELAETAEVEE